MSHYVCVDLESCDHQAIVTLEQSRPDAWSASQLSSQFQQPHNFVIRNAQGKCVAFALFQVVLNEATLLLVVVDRQLRRQGLAARLLQESLRRLMLSGVDRCFLELRESNRPAHALYQQLGFEQIGLRKHYYTTTDKTCTQGVDDREHAVVMQKLMGER